MKCDKTAFEDKKSAQKRLTEIKEHGEKRDRTPERVYLCPKCKKYHLTSMNISDLSKWLQKLKERVKIREERFINRETAYWTKKLKL